MLKKILPYYWGLYLRKDEHKNCSAFHAQPWKRPWLRITSAIFAIFMCWVLLLCPQATRADQLGWTSNVRPFD